MTEILDLIDRGLPTINALIDTFPNVKVAVPTWVIGAIGAMGIVHTAKAHRKKLGKPLDNMQVRVLAFAVASHLTFLTAAKLFDQPFDIALTHAILSGFLTPWVAAVLIAFVRSRLPSLANSASSDPYQTGSHGK